MPLFNLKLFQYVFIKLIHSFFYILLIFDLISLKIDLKKIQMSEIIGNSMKATNKNNPE